MKDKEIIFEPWDWRYLIKSDMAMRKNIRGVIDNIPDNKVRELYLNIYNFFLNVNLDNSESKNLNLYLEVILTSEQLEFIKHYKTSYEITSPPSLHLSEDEFVKTVNDLSSELRNRLGFNFETKIESSKEGFAEYWPRSLTNKLNDELIIFSNSDTRELYNLQLTIEHEILGHGQFYKILEDKKVSFIDHGCVLIEGWPTYVEWQNKKNPRSSFNKDFAVKMLQSKMNGDMPKIKKILETADYSDSIIKSSMKTYKNMIGFSESYALGALLIENKFGDSFNTKKLENILKSGCGDHLIWNFI